MPLRSAGFPYWELAPACWERALDSVLELRLRILRVDVPWVLHEYAPGSYDWGERRAELDLGRLLRLAHRKTPSLGKGTPEPGAWTYDDEESPGMREPEQAPEIEVRPPLAPVIAVGGVLVQHPRDIDAQDPQPQLQHRVERTLPARGCELPVGEARRA